MATLYLHHLLADPTRARLLDALAAADHPLGVRDLAVLVGRHPNSVREQLERLVDAGLVERGIGPSTRRGRPPHRYTLARRGPSERAGVTSPPAAESSPRTVASLEASTGGALAADADGYRALARVLAEALLRSGRIEAAERAGEAWGAALVTRRTRRTGPRRALRRLVTILDRAGFGPEPATDPSAPIRLRRCPFAALARERQEVVCSVHLGMLRGAVRAMTAPLRVTALEPFVRPDLCLVRLAPAAEAVPGRGTTDA